MNAIINLIDSFKNSSMLVKFSVASFLIGLPIYAWMANTTVGAAFIYLGLGIGLLNNLVLLFHQYIKSFQFGELMLLGYTTQAQDFRNIWLGTSVAYAVMFAVFGHFEMAILQSIIGLQMLAILRKLPTEE